MQWKPLINFQSLIEIKSYRRKEEDKHVKENGNFIQNLKKDCVTWENSSISLIFFLISW